MLTSIIIQKVVYIDVAKHPDLTKKQHACVPLIEL